MKIRIRIRHFRRLPLDDLALFLSAFFVFSYGVLENANLAFPIFSSMKFPLLYAGLACLLYQAPLLLRNVMKRRYFFTLLLLAALCLLLLCSAYVNRNQPGSFNPMHKMLRMVLYLVELFALMIWAAEKGKIRFLLNFLFRYELLLLLVTDVLLFTRIATFRSGSHELYLVGNKFSVSYLHMNLVTLWFLRNNMRLFRPGRAKWILPPAAVFLLILTIRVDCVTGIIGCAALVCFLMLLNTRFQQFFLRFNSPVMLLLFLAAIGIFPFMLDSFLSIPFVKILIEDVFHRNLSLTGRTLAFDNFIQKAGSSMLWGYGLGNSYLASMKMFGIANAQNALLQWVLESGIPAAIVFILLLLQIFRPISASPWRRQVMPLVVMVYVYVLLGSVEITFGESFMIWIALVFGQVNDKFPPPSLINASEKG